ncbi:hypothetical protein [Streptomyces buecherae]|uniref:hypothetical protein n=1 Tax=Streptomyces buecherae TaxID=2763006 RepID=UPI003659D369
MLQIVIEVNEPEHGICRECDEGKSYQPRQNFADHMANSVGRSRPSVLNVLLIAFAFLLSIA